MSLSMKHFAVEPIEVDTMEPLTYQGHRVLPTDLAAKAFGDDAKRLQENYSRNRERFEEGKHFFKVAGAELKELKRQPAFSGVASKFASVLYLWTDRGIARHAKILETEMAWSIYERLEDTYFAKSAPQLEPPRQLTAAESFLQMAQMQVAAERRSAEQDRQIKAITVEVEQIKQFQSVVKSCPTNAEPITRIKKRIGAEMGLSSSVIDVVMRECPYSPRPATMVENDHEDAMGATYAVWWKRDVNAVFKRFADECRRETTCM